MVTARPAIPRILHQVWLGAAEPPARMLSWHAQFRDANPTWDVRLWRDADLPASMAPRSVAIAAAIPGTPGCVLRGDIARIELLARFGGVYLDMDVEPVAPLDALAGDGWHDAQGCRGASAWVALEHDDVTANAVMGFPAGHPALWVMLAAIEHALLRRRRVGDQTGPLLLRDVLRGRRDVALLPPAWFHPLVSQVYRNPDSEALARAKHWFAGTWIARRRSEYPDLWRANGVAVA